MVEPLGKSLIRDLGTNGFVVRYCLHLQIQQCNANSVIKHLEKSLHSRYCIDIKSARSDCMQWILLVIIVAGLLYLSRFYPKTGFSILGVLVLGAIFIIITSSERGENARAKLPTDDIIIENPVMTLGYREGYTLSARLINQNDSSTLRDSAISITMFDCLTSDRSSCTVIGQEEERINLVIPPGQSRDLSRYVSFEAVSPKGNIEWEFKVTQTRS